MTESITSSLIRRYVDGELSLEEVAALEERLKVDAETREQVEFEQHLRDRVSTAMGSVTPVLPEGLADRIRAVLDKSGAEQEQEQETEPPVPVIVGRIGSDVPLEPSAQARTRKWMLPQRANALAVAATLVIIAGVIVVSIFAPAIGTDMRAKATADAVKFIAENHGACSHDEAYLAKEAPYRDALEAQEELSRHMGPEMRIFNLAGLTDGYEFVGGGKCEVPGGENSCHLIYQRAPSDRDDPNRTSPYIASVFIELNDGQFDFSQRLFDHAYKACGPDGDHKATYFTDGKLVYFVICCDIGDLDAVRDAVSRQLQAAP